MKKNLSLKAAALKQAADIKRLSNQLGQQLDEIVPNAAIIIGVCYANALGEKTCATTLSGGSFNLAALHFVLGHNVHAKLDQDYDRANR